MEDKYFNNSKVKVFNDITFDQLKELYPNKKIDLIDTIFKEYDNLFGFQDHKDNSESLALCDIIVFISNWTNEAKSHCNSLIKNLVPFAYLYKIREE